MYLPWLGSKGQNLIKDRGTDKKSVKYQPLSERTTGQRQASGKVKGLYRGLPWEKPRRREVKTSQGNLGRAKLCSEVYLNFSREGKSSVEGMERYLKATLHCSKSLPYNI